MKRVAELEKKKHDAAAVAVEAALDKSCFDLDDRSVIPQFDQEYIQIIVIEVLDGLTRFKQTFNLIFFCSLLTLVTFGPSIPTI